VDPGKPDTSTDVGPETPATPKAKGNAAIAPAKAAAIRDAQERSLQTIGEALRPNDPDVTTNEAIDAIVVRISREHGGNVDKKDLAAQIRAALNAPTPENVSAVIGHDRDSGSVSAKRNRPVTTALVSSLGTQTIAAAAAELPQATEQHRKDVARIAEVGDWATDQGERAGIVSTHISNEVEKNAVLVAQYSNEKDGWTTERADAMFEDGIKAMNENTRTLGKTLPGLLG
jgi:hypothetical protein